MNFEANFGPEGLEYKTQQSEPRWVVLPPVVYRYMDQHYIDEFFATGRLMLSSFRRFKQHADEQRGDENEGLNVVTGLSGDRTVLANVESGPNSYVLCTSVHGNEGLMRQFGTDGYFRITDTHYFGRAIASRLVGYTDGLEGFCTYRDEHVIRKHMPPSVSGKFDFDAETGPDLERVIEAVMGLAGAEALFSKRRIFERQTEYRIIWNMDRKVEGSIIVECPEAVQFCERVTGA